MMIISLFFFQERDQNHHVPSKISNSHGDVCRIRNTFLRTGFNIED